MKDDLALLWEGLDEEQRQAYATYGIENVEGLQFSLNMIDKSLKEMIQEPHKFIASIRSIITNIPESSQLKVKTQMVGRRFSVVNEA